VFAKPKEAVGTNTDRGGVWGGEGGVGERLLLFDLL